MIIFYYYETCINPTNMEIKKNSIKYIFGENLLIDDIWNIHG